MSDKGWKESTFFRFVLTAAFVAVTLRVGNEQFGPLPGWGQIMVAIVALLSGMMAWRHLRVYSDL